MRDYINRLSRGSSIIKVPKLSCSEEQITMDIMCNTAVSYTHLTLPTTPYV